MDRKHRARLALVLAASMPLTACTSTHLEGLYLPLARDVSKSKENQVLAKGSNWVWLWGLMNSGTFEFNEEVKHGLRPDEGFADMEIKDHLSIGGFFLWLITAGIVSHHTLVAKGAISTVASTAPSSAPPAAPAPGTTTTPR